MYREISRIRLFSQVAVAAASIAPRAAATFERETYLRRPSLRSRIFARSLARARAALDLIE